jgi:hypothetical protein
MALHGFLDGWMGLGWAGGTLKVLHVWLFFPSAIFGFFDFSLSLIFTSRHSLALHG